MNLDVLTLLYASGLVVAATGASFVISSIFRRDDDVARLWGLGFISGMLATIAYAAWNYSPEVWWVTGVGNAALAFAIGAMWAGCQAFNGKRPRLWIPGLVALVVFLAVVIHGPGSSEWAGAPAEYIAIAVFSTGIVIATLTGNMRRRVNARILTVIFIAVAGYYGIRAVVYFVYGETSTQFLSDFGTVNTTLLNIAFLTIASISFSVLQTERRPGDHGEASVEQSSLAGIASTELFEQQAEDWLRRAHRADDELTLAIFEVENLDHVNNALGTDYGDRAIHTVGWITRDSVPTTSLVGRLGARRFAVMTSMPAVGASRGVAERVMTAIAENPIDEIEGVRATAAFGYADTSRAGYDYRQLFRAAVAAVRDNV